MAARVVACNTLCLHDDKHRGNPEVFVPSWGEERKSRKCPVIRETPELMGAAV